MEEETKEDVEVCSLFAKRRNILWVDFDLVDYDSTLRMIEHWRRSGESHYVTLANPHSVLLCHRNEQMRRATAGAGMTLPDGVGIILAANLLGYKHKGRQAGPTLMLKLCDLGCKYGYRHYFYGGVEGVAEKLAQRLGEKYPSLQIAGTYSPPFRILDVREDEKIVKIINSTDPDIVWVGLGAPKQEEWMAEHIGKINATAMIGVGAAFDFHSGNVKRAPNWVRQLGLEWIYRTIREPRRIGPKAMDNLLFAVRVLEFCIKQKLGIAD